MFEIQPISTLGTDYSYSPMSPSFHFAAPEECKSEINALSNKSLLFTSAFQGVGSVIIPRTESILDATSQMLENIKARGTTYGNNTVASRRGYLAEEFVAGTFNIDAKIKNSSSTAYTNKSTGAASADITYGDGKTASLKFYGTAEDSIKAQMNKDYLDQDRIIPKDQYEVKDSVLDPIIKRNEQKGRTEAAKYQEELKDKFSDRIKDGNVESTPLTKEQADELSKAFHGNEVDTVRLKKVMKETGVYSKVKKAIIRNEIKGLGISVAIGVGIGFSIGLISSLAQDGITTDRFADALDNAGKSAIQSGLQAAAGYGIARTLGALATHSLVNILETSGIEVTENIFKMCQLGAIGAITTVIFSAYQFAKLKYNGVSTSEAAMQVGKQTLFSLSVVAVSMAAQGAWGGPAGILVSTGISLMYVAYNTAKTAHARILESNIREYTIEEYKKVIDEKKLLYIC